MIFDMTTHTPCTKSRIFGSTALLAGISAGFAFLLCLAGAAGLVGKNDLVFIGCGLACFGSAIALLARR